MGYVTILEVWPRVAPQAARMQGVCVCATPILQGFTELPSSAAHHELPSETQNSELFRILLAFLGELGSWGAGHYFYYTATLSTTNYNLIKIK